MKMKNQINKLSQRRAITSSISLQGTSSSAGGALFFMGLSGVLAKTQFRLMVGETEDKDRISSSMSLWVAPMKSNKAGSNPASSSIILEVNYEDRDKGSL